MSKVKHKFEIYYHEYNMLASGYVFRRKIVYTNDIYHEIGLLICRSINDIKSICFREISND